MGTYLKNKPLGNWEGKKVRMIHKPGDLPVDEFIAISFGGKDWEFILMYFNPIHLCWIFLILDSKDHIMLTPYG